MTIEERDEILNRRLPDEEVARRISEPSQPKPLPEINLGMNGGEGEPISIQFIMSIGFKYIEGDVFKNGDVTLSQGLNWFFCVDFEDWEHAKWKPLKNIRHLVDLLYNINIKPYLQ